MAPGIKGTNHGAHGVKGRSGRKGAGTERANYELLEKIFFEIIDRNEVAKMLKSGRYSIKDVMVSKAYAGNERFIQAIFNKLFPDKADITSGGEKLETFDEGRIAKIARRILDGHSSGEKKPD